MARANYGYAKRQRELAKQQKKERKRQRKQEKRSAAEADAAPAGLAPDELQTAPVHLTEPARITCPSCGEVSAIVLDLSAGSQEYVEDCQVCCRPMTLTVTVDADGQPAVDARGEHE